jgi:hypothetical protein
MLSEHQGAHSDTGEVRTQHEKLVVLPAARCSGKSDVAHPDKVAVEEGDEGFGLGGRDEGHVVAQASSQRRGVRGGRASCRQVARKHLQCCLVREDPNKKGVGLEATCDRGSLSRGLQSRCMVPLDHREGNLYVECSASDGVVATTGKQGIDPVGALRHSSVSPVLPQTGRHRQTEVRAIGVGQAVPQCGPEVVCFEIELVKRRELGRGICPGHIEFGEPAEDREEGKVCASGGCLLVRFAEPQQRELAHGLVQSIARPSTRSLTDDE